MAWGQHGYSLCVDFLAHQNGLAWCPDPKMSEINVHVCDNGLDTRLGKVR